MLNKKLHVFRCPTRRARDLSQVVSKLIYLRVSSMFENIQKWSTHLCVFVINLGAHRRSHDRQLTKRWCSMASAKISREYKVERLRNLAKFRFGRSQNAIYLKWKWQWLIHVTISAESHIFIFSLVRRVVDATISGQNFWCFMWASICFCKIWLCRFCWCFPYRIWLSERQRLVLLRMFFYICASTMVAALALQSSLGRTKEKWKKWTTENEKKKSSNGAYDEFHSWRIFFIYLSDAVHWTFSSNFFKFSLRPFLLLLNARRFRLREIMQMKVLFEIKSSSLN